MKDKCRVLIIIACGVLCMAGVHAQSQKVSTPSVWDFLTLERTILTSTSDSTFVVNFWATWCKPCVEELPSFLRLDSALRSRGSKTKVILVSLDFRKELQSKLVPFLRKRNISAEVVLFSDTNMNDWIDKVSPLWSGAIPATLILNNTRGIRWFAEQELHDVELAEIIFSLTGEQYGK